MTHLSPPLLTLVLLACGWATAAALDRQSSHKEDPVALTPWIPPPEYALKTTGHKTMYLADVSVSGQTFRLLVDTGSSMVILPGAGCTKRSLKFDASAAKPGQGTVSVKFGMGAVSGRVFEDKVCVQSSAALTEVGFLQQGSQTQQETRRNMNSGDACTQMKFLVADHETDDLGEAPFDGILGLGPESGAEGSGFSFLSQLVSNGASSSTAFALRLSNGDSQLLLGGADESSFAGGRAVWVPLSPAADGYWQFSVQDLALDGHSQQFGGLQVAVDSGTSLLAADDELRDWFREHLLPKDCSSVDHLPKLGLRVHGSILSILPADYIDQTEGNCELALMPSHLQSVSGQRLVLGDSFLRRYTTIFDRQNGRMGFGVAADDSMAKELLPGMFPDPTTTMAPLTTAGPPPPEHMDYQGDQYVPVTTRPPPSAAELEHAHQNADLSNAFDGLGDDLAGSFEKSISSQKGVLGHKDVKAASGEAIPAAPSAGADQDQEAANPYTSYLKFLQVRKLHQHK